MFDWFASSLEIRAYTMFRLAATAERFLDHKLEAATRTRRSQSIDRLDVESSAWNMNNEGYV